MLMSAKLISMTIHKSSLNSVYEECRNLNNCFLRLILRFLQQDRTRNINPERKYFWRTPLPLPAPNPFPLPAPNAVIRLTDVLRSSC